MRYRHSASGFRRRGHAQDHGSVLTVWYGIMQRLMRQRVPPDSTCGQVSRCGDLVPSQVLSVMTRTLRVFLYDAFAEEPFSGNPAGVVLDAEHVDDTMLQRVAAELNAPTTAFLVGRERGSGTAVHVRYFTAHQEIRLCGHAALALFAALVDTGALPRSPVPSRIRHVTGSFDLEVVVYGGGVGSAEVEVELPVPSVVVRGVDKGRVMVTLGAVVLHRILPLQIVDTGLRHLMLPLGDVGSLAALDPERGALIRLSKETGVDTVCAFTLPSGPGGPVRMRDFCAGIGATEEAASGTTAVALASYLVRHQVVQPASGQVDVEFEQGVELGRPSRIRAVLEADRHGIRRVAVRGRAVKVLEGVLRTVGGSARMARPGTVTLSGRGIFGGGMRM